ncbi:hypothetical protein CDAR_38041 [Caerostris darwini]|uniref:Secreted protein n=1 Tax=Caerostris darwini TaxID=1538125 RepID=A0AAV4WJA2_9ARAC|nr:hypothetical protein CDAR_38041 [Caerostris darwini]
MLLITLLKYFSSSLISKTIVTGSISYAEIPGICTKRHLNFNQIELILPCIKLYRKFLVPLSHPIPSMSRQGNFCSRFLMVSSGRRWTVTAAAPHCFIVVISALFSVPCFDRTETTRVSIRIRFPCHR